MDKTEENVVAVEDVEGEEQAVEAAIGAGTDTYTTKQIAALLQVSPSTAGRVMREIKSESDTLGISGVVHVQDYRYWLGVRLGKGKNYEKARALEKKLQRQRRKAGG